MTKLVLGLDPATTTGWVLLRGETVVNHGVHSMAQGRHDSQGMAYLRLDRWLDEILQLATPDLVAFEEVPRHRGVHAAHRYGGVVSHIMRQCEAQGVPYCGVPISTWKRMATGKGNANKAAVAEAFAREWAAAGRVAVCWTQDEIDAYYVGLAAVRGLA